jgi:hypothetical protein
MLKLKNFVASELLTSEELESKQEIFDKYKYALLAIGVDFGDEVLQNALINCNYGFEDVLRATIGYWYWLQNRDEPFYPNPCLRAAIGNSWDSRYWKDEYLNNPAFRNPRDLFWDEAAQYLGYDLRNRAILDVMERDDGDIYICFCSGRSLGFAQVKRSGWDWLKEYAQQQIEEKLKKEMILRQFKDS